MRAPVQCAIRMTHKLHHKLQHVTPQKPHWQNTPLRRKSPQDCRLTSARPLEGVGDAPPLSEVRPFLLPPRASPRGLVLIPDVSANRTRALPKLTGQHPRLGCAWTDQRGGHFSSTPPLGIFYPLNGFFSRPKAHRPLTRPIPLSWGLQFRGESWREQSRGPTTGPHCSGALPNSVLTDALSACP